MPNKQAAKKYLRKSKKVALKNLQDKKIIKDLQRKIEKALALKEPAKIAELRRSYQKKIDKAVKTGWLKKNTGNRRKSRLAAKVKRVLVKFS